MMGKTHIAVGTACALALVGMTGPAGCAAAVIGGPLGAVACDIDVRSTARCTDARRARIAAVAIAAAALAADYLGGGDALARLASVGAGTLLAAGALLAVMAVLTRLSAHRSFSHSLLALALWCIPLALVSSPLAVAFAAGFASHILLDLLNKMPVRLLFPLRAGLCTGSFRADGVADTVLFLCGTVASATLLGVCLLQTTGVLTPIG